MLYTISLENSIRVKEALKTATKAWLFQFLKMDGLQNLITMLLKFQGMEDKEPNELRIQYELLLCVKSAMNSQTGLDLMIGQPDLVASLALNIDSEDSAICTQTLELLAVLMVSGDNGARAVLEALDFFKLVTRERVRFQCLVDALHSNGTSFAFKRDIILFLNTVVNTATDLEERLEIRADLIYSGILPTVEKLKQLCFDELGKDFAEDYNQEATERMEEVQELEAQLQVFETVMQRDIAECVTDMETTFQSTEVDLSDPEQIFQSLHASCVEHECFMPFLSVLQTLLMIPSYDSFGKLKWEAVDGVLKKIVAGEIISATEDYSPEMLIFNAKQNLTWKQKVEELSQQVEQMRAKCQEMEEAETILKDELEEMRKKESFNLYMREKDRKAAEVLNRQVRHMQELREFEKGIVTRAEEILVSGEHPTSMRRRSSNARLLTNRSDLLKNSPVAGITAGPVARPVMRIQGSRNLLNTSMSDEDDEAEQMEMHSNPMLSKSNSEVSMDGHKNSTRASPSPGRGFGRGFGLSRPSMNKLKSKDTPIPEEQEISSRSLNYSENSDGFDPTESFESIHLDGVHSHSPPNITPTQSPFRDSHTPTTPELNKNNLENHNNASTPLTTSNNNNNSNNNNSNINVNDDNNTEESKDQIRDVIELDGKLQHMTEVARASLLRADSKDVEFIQMKRKMFDLEVKLQEAQRELQRELDLARERENDLKRKLKQQEAGGPVEDPRESIFSLLQKRTPVRPVATVEGYNITPAPNSNNKDANNNNNNNLQSNTTTTPNNDRKSTGNIMDKLDGNGVSNLNALFGAVKTNNDVKPDNINGDNTINNNNNNTNESPQKDLDDVSGTGRQRRGALLGVGIGLKKGDEVNINDNRAVKISRVPPKAPPLPPGALAIIQSKSNLILGGIPFAPPLPGDFQTNIPEQETEKKPKKIGITPKIPMRSLFWNKIPDRNIHKTIWDHLSDQDVKLDLNLLESLFCKAVAKISDEEKKDNQADKPEKTKEITILDTKVQQNVGIALVKYRMPSHEIRKAIIRMDEKKLDLEKLLSLRALAPTPDDITALKEYDGDVEALGRVEKFFLQIIDIPRYTLRLDCFIFMRKFQMLISEAYCQHDILNRAIDQVEHSTSLKKILEIVLALGNYLNGGTPRGGVYGFKLDGLQKLSTVKSVDNKLSLMHFLAMHCESIDNGLIISKLEEELSMAEEASRISLESCRSEITMLKKNITLIQEQIAAHQQEVIKDPTDLFVEKLYPFVTEAIVEVNKLEVEYNAMTKHFITLTESYGEDDGSKITTEEFFKVIKEFIEGFLKAFRDNEKRRIMLEKAEMKKMAEEKKKKIRFEKKAALASDVETLVDDVFGTLRGKKADEIVDSLKLTSGLRRKKSNSSRRIGSGGQNNRKVRNEFDIIEDHEHEEDDALLAMMNQLGIESSNSRDKKKKVKDEIDPSSPDDRPITSSPPPLSSEIVKALTSEIISDRSVSISPSPHSPAVSNITPPNKTTGSGVSGSKKPGSHSTTTTSSSSSTSTTTPITHSKKISEDSGSKTPTIRKKVDSSTLISSRGGNTPEITGGSELDSFLKRKKESSNGGLGKKTIGR